MRRLLKTLLVLLFAAFLPLSLKTAWADELNVYVDRSDPIIVVSNTRLDGNKLTVTGTAFDEYSGIQTVEASAEGKPFETVGVYPTGAGGEWIWIYTVSEDCGQYGHFVFRAVDNAGNTAEISRNDIGIYNKKAALIFPDYVIKNIAVTPEVVGEPVRAVVNVSGHGYDYEEWELTGPDFTLVWDGFITGGEVPAGNYLLTVRTYNQTGHSTVTNLQAIVPADGDDKKGDNDHYRDTTISGTVEDISDDDAVISGQNLVITDDSEIDDSIKPGDKVIGLGRYDTVTGEIEIRILKKTEEPVRSLPDIEIDSDEKIGEMEFGGIIEAVGPDYIVVDGKVIFITEYTEINCDFSELHPGDYVSGLTEIFSKSGTKALIINKADNHNAKSVHTEANLQSFENSNNTFEEADELLPASSEQILDNADFMTAEAEKIIPEVPVKNSNTQENGKEINIEEHQSENQQSDPEKGNTPDNKTEKNSERITAAAADINSANGNSELTDTPKKKELPDFPDRTDNSGCLNYTILYNEHPNFFDSG